MECIFFNLKLTIVISLNRLIIIKALVLNQHLLFTKIIIINLTKNFTKFISIDYFEICLVIIQKI